MPDGTYTVERTDSEGNTHRETKQRFTSIPVHMFYHSGFVSIGTYKGVEGAQGFDVTISPRSPPQPPQAPYGYSPRDLP